VSLIICTDSLEEAVEINRHRLKTGFIISGIEQRTGPSW
jgi:hypothetical protein